MNVGQLKERLEGVADDIEVVTPGGDHQYFSCGGGPGFAECWDGCDYIEYFGDEHMQDGEKVEVFIVGSD